jgi:hypothetical protein
LAFRQETLAPRWVVTTAVQEFDSNLALNFTVDPLGQIDRRHAATSDSGNQPVIADLLATARLLRGTQRDRYFPNRILEPALYGS